MMLPLHRLHQFIHQNHLFDSQNAILAAVSGGMDSVLMVQLFKAAGIRFSIAHCNFQLRGADADADQQFCKNLATQLDVPFYTINFDTAGYAAAHKISIQMSARDLRYAWFEQIRQQHHYDVIALAHHQNDAIETILLNLTRGTGIAGLHGILPKNGCLIRPMLFMDRAEIEALITEYEFDYVEDASNTSTKYARNKIRLEVIPRLKEMNPSLESTFGRSLQHFRDLETLLQLEVGRLKKELITSHDEELRIPLSRLRSLQPQRLLIYNLLNGYGFNETTIDDLIDALDKHPGRVFRSTRYQLTLDRDQLILIKRPAALPEAVQINPGDHSVIYSNYKVTILHDDVPLIIKDNPLAVAVDADQLVYPLTVRAWQSGDFFYPLGMKARKKLSDFFIHHKLPLHQKNEVPLLINGNGEVVWVGGYRPDERYKVRNNTKKVTIFELFKLQ